MNAKKIDTPTLILIVILMMGLINGLTSCSPKMSTCSYVRSSYIGYR